MFLTQNFYSISNLVADTEVKEYTTFRETIILSDFTEFDLVLSNSHLRANISNSKIDIYRRNEIYDDSSQRIKMIYSLPEEFSCYKFSYEMQVIMSYTDLHEVGLLEFKFSSDYDPANVGTMNTNTQARSLIIGRPYRSSVGFHVGRLNDPNDFDFEDVKEYTTNIPKSVLFWGNRTSSDNTELTIDKLGTKTHIVNRKFLSSNENNLQYISIGYSAYEYDDHFNVTLSNLKAILYSTEEKKVLDLNASKYTNFSEVVGLTLPIISICTLFLGVSLIVIRKRRE